MTYAHTKTLPWNWRHLKRTELIKFLEPYGTPCRHSMRKAQLIRVIESFVERERAIAAEESQP